MSPRRVGPEDPPDDGGGPLYENLPTPDEEGRITKQFRLFHAENPHVYAMFCRFSMEAYAAGWRTCASSLIFERMRWETGISTKGEPVKINNNYKPFYARMFMRDHPALTGFFQLRAWGSGPDSQWCDEDDALPPYLPVNS